MKYEILNSLINLIQKAKLVVDQSYKLLPKKEEQNKNRIEEKNYI